MQPSRSHFDSDCSFQSREGQEKVIQWRVTITVRLDPEPQQPPVSRLGLMTIRYPSSPGPKLDTSLLPPSLQQPSSSSCFPHSWEKFPARLPTSSGNRQPSSLQCWTRSWYFLAVRLGWSSWPPQTIWHMTIWVWWFEQFEHPGENAVSLPGLPSFPTMLLWAGGPSWSFWKMAVSPYGWWAGFNHTFSSAWCFLCLFFSDTIFTSAGREHSCTPSCAIIRLSTHGLQFGSSLIPHQCRGFVFEGCNEQSWKEMQKGCRSPEFRPGGLGRFPFAQAPCDRSSTTLDLFASSSSCWPASCIVPLLCHRLTLPPLL